jgi:MIP family channel proteins
MERCEWAATLVLKAAMQIETMIRKSVAELVGTFAFFFAGISAIINVGAFPSTNPGWPAGLLVVAFAHGIMLAIMISTLGAISGGHFNPAVSFGLFAGKVIDLPTMVSYWIAQLIGGTLAALAAKSIFTSVQYGLSHIGLPTLGAGVDSGTALFLEAVLTFFLVLSVYGTAVDPRHPPIGGLGIGLTVFVDILIGGPLTGASMNPARSFGPALVSNYWNNHLIYWLGPLVGALIAGLLYSYLFLPKAAAASAR